MSHAKIESIQILRFEARLLLNDGQKQLNAKRFNKSLRSTGILPLFMCREPLCERFALSA